MASVLEIMQLCRLCLEKDEVNTPIFEGQGDIRQIFLKISACLPVKVSKEDKLPKNICDGCSCKLEMLYQFWNTSANAEKKLIRWLDQIGTDKLSDKEEAAVPLQSQHSISSVPVVLKQEVDDVVDSQSTGDDIVPDDLNVSNDSQEYLLQQEQLPYQPVEFQFQQDGFDPETADDDISQNVESDPLPKQRKRRAAAMKTLPTMDSEDEDDPDLINTKIAKTEEQSEESGGEDMTEPTTFVGVPSADDDEQPGPSGVGKTSGDAPSSKSLRKNERLNGGKIKERSSKRSAYKCDVCYKQFAKKQLLQYHQDRHAQRYKVKCDLCDKGFYTMFDFKRHYAARHKGVRFICSSCNKSFLDENCFRRHVKTHDSGYVKTEHKCLECDKIYNTKGGLNVHMKLHKNIWYVCDVCGKAVTSKTSLKHHIMLHTGEKPFVCETCGKCFNKKMLLRIHDRIHTKIKPYNCAQCGKSFSQRSTLTIHMRYHTGNRPYTCNICQKTFVTKTLLKMHLKVHGTTLVNL